VLIYLLIVVNFQSWSDPFVIVCALPAALAGIVWLLFATGTTLSVPALTGAIMCMGVATANSVLVISFARERLAELGDPLAAALEAGLVRFRPVLMTALAMIIGMAPMALGLGRRRAERAARARGHWRPGRSQPWPRCSSFPLSSVLVHVKYGRDVAPSPVIGALMSPEPVVHPGFSPRTAYRRPAGRRRAVVVVGWGIAARAANGNHLRQWTAAQAPPS